MANKKRLIDATRLRFEANRFFRNDSKVQDDVDSLICMMPIVDAVEVVRCRDCKHLIVANKEDLYAYCPKMNTCFLPFQLDTREHFCSKGERKDND